MIAAVIDETHDARRTSWVPGADGHAEFPIQNLPFGIFDRAGETVRPGVAIGDFVVDLGALRDAGDLPPAASDVLTGPTLNALFALPASDRVALRRTLSVLLSDAANRPALGPKLHPVEDCHLHLPAAIGDYSDFYVGIHHARNVGEQFRPDNPLLPNYKHVPIGYHGRASSIRPSGLEVVRPWGQQLPPGSDVPVFAPSTRLDFELELGIWIGCGTALGRPVSIAKAGDHIAGLCLLNDWSARDLQAWEYQPLGPFLAKNFHSTISPWVVTMEALAPYRIAQPARPAGDPAPLPYLHDPNDQARGAFAIELETAILTWKMREAGLAPHLLSRTDASNMYWTVAQMLAHHASNGCNLNPGDLLGTGTISSATADGYGSLLEITRGGKQPVPLPNGETRSFLEDGDEVLFAAHARAEGRVQIGFGPCRAMLVPAIG